MVTGSRAAPKMLNTHTEVDTETTEDEVLAQMH